LPLDVVNRWNASRRFARLQLSPPFLALSLDFSLAGGVTQTYVRAQIEIWDHLMQQLVSFLREELAILAKAKAPAGQTGNAAAAQPSATNTQRIVEPEAPRAVQ